MGYGDGSFIEQSKGKWVGFKTIDGTRYKRTGPNKTAVKAKFADLAKELGKGPAAKPSGVTVAEVLTAFLERDLAGRKRAPSTVNLHHWAAAIITEHIGTKRAEALRVREVDDMLDALADKGMSRSSMLRIRNTLSQALDYARKREDITRNAARDATIPAQARRTAERTALSPDDARRLLDALRDERNGLMFALSLRLGLRPGEAAGLHWSDIGADRVNVTRAVRKVGGRVEVVDDLKTSSAKRTIGLPDDLIAWFGEHRKAQAADRLAASTWVDERLVFTTPTGHVTDPTKNRRQLAAICERLEAERVEHDPEGSPFPTIKPNELRHSCASLLADAGVMNEEIADLLGHTTTAMVDATYRHRLRPVVDVAARATWVAN